MGTSYDAHAGYGIKVTEEMCYTAAKEMGVEYDEYLGIDGFVDEYITSKLSTTVTGNCYWDEPLDVWYMLDDPLNKDMDAFIEELNKLPFNLDIKSYKDLKWIQEMWVG